MKILIVEDEPKARVGLAMLIQRMDPSAQIQTTSNGKAALAMCRETMFDIIFTDIKMPGMSGLEMLDKLDTYCQQTVIVSGYADFSYAQTAIQYGVADYLLKPVSPTKLKELLVRVKKNVHSIKKTCLAGYLQDYTFLEEDHRRYLHQRLDLSDQVLLLWKERNTGEEDAQKNHEEQANLFSGLEGDVYSLTQAGIRLWVISGTAVEEKAAQEAAAQYGLKAQMVSTDQLPEFYHQLTQTELAQGQEHTEGSRTVRLVKQFIKENYASDISLKVLSKITYLHPNYLSKIFKRETGENISDYILNYRIEQAKKLLKDPSLKIYEVAELSGFHTSKYFAALFKGMVGITPSQYRDSL